MLQWDGMENTPEQDKTQVSIYKKKVQLLIRENRSFFITGLIALVFIVYVFCLQLGTQILASLKTNIAELFTFKAQDGDKITSPDLSNTLANIKIDNATPNQVPKDKELDINGQISAISSGRVTYTKNKYIVQRGDSLASIAQKVYGDKNAWVRIAQANNLASPDLIEVGMELVIPR